MNAELAERWRSRAKPFDGATVELPRPGLPLADLRHRLIRVVAELRAQADTSALETLEDWHEHDGYVKAGMATKWDSLTDALASDDALLQLWPGDTFVRRGYVPPNFEWYLRIGFDDDNELDDLNPPTRGTFDLTCHTSLADAVAKHIPGLVRHSAGEFFDRGWAG